MNRKEEYFTCECHSTDHIVRFMVDEADKDMLWPPELYIEVQLHQWRGFFHRLWVGLKYIFGYKCRYGHWDCTIFKHEDIDRMKRVFELYDTYYEEYEKQKGCVK